MMMKLYSLEIVTVLHFMHNIIEQNIIILWQKNNAGRNFIRRKKVCPQTEAKILNTIY